MTNQFMDGLVEACSAHVDEIRIARRVETTYLATVLVASPAGVVEVDARPSDALNLAAVVQAPIVVESSMLRHGDELHRVGNAAQGHRFGDLLDRTEIVQQIRERGERSKQFFEQLLPKGEEPKHL
jgi:bifunctional DNase/RNase